MRWSRASAFVLALALCGASSQQPDGDSVKILSLSPSPKQPLRVGEKVAFRVEVEYNLTSATTGSVTLVIQQGESGRSPLANETEVVQKGRARTVLSKDIVVPDTKALQVFTPLSVQGSTSTTIVDRRLYRVVLR